MPPLRTIDITTLAQEKPEVNHKEQELARNFEQYQRLIVWMRAGNWDGSTLMLPMPRRMANGSHGHWSYKLAMQNQYIGVLNAMQCARLVPAPPKEPPQCAQLASHLFLRSEMDDDNALARLKWPIDWLVNNHYLAGDKRKNLRNSIPLQTVTHREPQRIEFGITPL
jgi:hypothetical protein